PPARCLFLVRCVRHVEPLLPWRLCEFVNRWRKSSAIGGGNPPPIDHRQKASPSYLLQLSRAQTLFLVGAGRASVRSYGGGAMTSGRLWARRDSRSRPIYGIRSAARSSPAVSHHER